MATAPHLAELTLTYAAPDRAEEFLRTTARGFHLDYEPEPWLPARELFEPSRAFGFTVEDRWVTTCISYPRVMTVPGGSLPVAAVTYVTVQPAYRRRGLLTQMMRHQLETLAERGDEPVALLWASEAAIYGRYGYGAATAQLGLSGATGGTAFRPEVVLGPGSVGEVDLDEFREVVVPLHARLLPGRPGALDRSSAWWDRVLADHPARRKGWSAVRHALHHDASGAVDGHVSFRVRPGEPGEPDSGGTVQVLGLDAATAPARARLWRFVLDLDLVPAFEAYVALDEPLLHLLADVRAVNARFDDATYVRLVDLPRALEARRYAADLDVVLGVRDALLPQNHGTFRLRGGPDGAEVRRVDADPDVELDVRELGAVFLGGTSAGALHRAGLLAERTTGAVARLSAAFTSPQQPFCPDQF